MANPLNVRMIRRGHIAAFFILSLALLVSSAFAQAPARLVAVGDVHGDYDAFVAILQKAGLIDDKLHWSGNNTVLVQVGDILDRGPKCREVMDLLMALEAEAPRTGGRVVALLGNHEAMNIMGDMRYAAPMYASFADKNSEKRRKATYDAFVSWQKARSAGGKLAASAPSPNAEADWMTAHPLGYVEQREAMSPSGKYGRWLRERPAVAQIGSTLFVHGGISPQLATWKAETMAGRVRSELKAFDDLTRTFQQQEIVLRTFDLGEITAAISAELDFRNTELAKKEASTSRDPKDLRLPGGFDAEKMQIQQLSSFLSYPSWFCINPAGPLWFRGYATWSDEEGSAQVGKLLEGLGVTQIVVAHTPQQSGRITARFDARVFLIDTGMLSSYYEGGRASALEIVAGKFTAIYPDQSIVLLDPAATKGGPAGVPASREVGNSKEIHGGGIDEEQQAQPATGQAAAPAAAPAPHVWLDPDGKPLPFKSDEEVLEFLRTAKIGKCKDIALGVTHPRKCLVEKDGIRANAKFSNVSEQKDSVQLASGQRELNFRDDAIFDMAAQVVANMLGLDNFPPVVQRSIGGDKGILQIWVENVMNEKDRVKDKITPPDPVSWNYQIQTMRFYDNLVYNTDRNQGNILIDKNWKIWLIDHTRAFRRQEGLLNKDGLVTIDKKVWEKLLAINEQALRDQLKPYLQRYEIDSLVKRRTKIIEHYRAEIAKRGEKEVVREGP